MSVENPTFEPSPENPEETIKRNFLAALEDIDKLYEEGAPREVLVDRIVQWVKTSTKLLEAEGGPKTAQAKIRLELGLAKLQWAADLGEEAWDTLANPETGVMRQIDIIKSNSGINDPNTGQIDPELIKKAEDFYSFLVSKSSPKETT